MTHKKETAFRRGLCVSLSVLLAVTLAWATSGEGSPERLRPSLMTRHLWPMLQTLGPHLTIPSTWLSSRGPSSMAMPRR